MGAVTRVVIIMPLTKECPQCCSVVNVRESKFYCGHLYVTKHSKPVLTIKSRKSSLIHFTEYVIQLDHMIFTHSWVHKVYICDRLCENQSYESKLINFADIIENRQF